MGAPGTPSAQTAESGADGAAPLPGDDSETFDDGGDAAGSDDHAAEAAPAVTTARHDVPAEPVQPVAPQHASPPAPAADPPHQGSAPPPGPGNGDTDPQ